MANTFKISAAGLEALLNLGLTISGPSGSGDTGSISQAPSAPAPAPK